MEDAERIKTIEATTNHDVKAIEYFLKEKFDQHPGDLSKYKELIHFSCTSEDINNLAYALMIKRSTSQVMHPALDDLYSNLEELSIRHAGVPMMCRTHGQSATPSTMGKELANFAYRLKNQIKEVKRINPQGKFNGAVGNLNAHKIAYPDKDWVRISQRFVEDALGLQWNPYTTQIEPHDVSMTII